MPDEICGVRIRREKAHFEGWQLNVGHEWIEFINQYGGVSYRAGFWPRGIFYPYTGGLVQCPDEMEGTASSKVRTLSLFRREKDSDGLDCRDADCEDIRECIARKVRLDQANPRNYSLFLFNCRNWAHETLSRCCLSKAGPEVS